MNRYAKGIIEIQQKIFTQTNQRTDAHFEVGKGALFVPEFAELKRENVIYAASIMELHMRSL